MKNESLDELNQFEYQVSKETVFVYAVLNKVLSSFSLLSCERRAPHDPILTAQKGCPLLIGTHTGSFPGTFQTHKTLG